MNKKVYFQEEGRDGLMRGISILSNAVSSTLGPYGRNVIINSGERMPFSTKDGVTVAENIEFENELENMGAQLIKQASIKTNSQSGDGTTTSTILASKTVELGMEFMKFKEVNVTQLKSELVEASKLVRNYIVNEISKDITSESQLKQIAKISANNSEEMGTLVSTALNNVGKDGIVHIEESKTGETYIETVEGLQFDKGYKSPYFVTDNDTMSSKLSNPLILIIDGKLSKIKQLIPTLERISAEGRSLLIIAEDIDNEALAALVVNKGRGTLNVCAVKAPDYGERRKMILEDIAISTGGVVISLEKGMNLDNMSWDWFGEAQVANITKDDTTIIDGKGDEKTIEDRIKSIKTQIESPQATAFQKEHLQSRLGRFVGGVSIIYVGGITEPEMLERKYRVTDALHATKAALEEGILPGGGVAFIKALKCLLDIDTDGSSIMKEVIKEPFRRIYLNAGQDITHINNCIDKILLGKEDHWESINVIKGGDQNMRDEGILDPTKVTRNALTNAVSIASTILLTECVVCDVETDKSPNPGANMMDQMGMM
jgi:chaperonin GroEL